MRPENSPAAHLQFHLRHEIPHLEFLSRLFEKSGPDFVQDWVIAHRLASMPVGLRFYTNG